jgi:hypothetical protein
VKLVEVKKEELLEMELRKWIMMWRIVGEDWMDEYVL